MTLDTVRRPPPPSYTRMSAPLMERDRLQYGEATHSGNRPRSYQEIHVGTESTTYRPYSEEEASRVHGECPTQRIHEHPIDGYHYLTISI